VHRLTIGDGEELQAVESIARSLVKAGRTGRRW
jgi:hypothetical protein